MWHLSELGSVSQQGGCDPGRQELEGAWVVGSTWHLPTVHQSLHCSPLPVSDGIESSVVHHSQLGDVCQALSALLAALACLEDGRFLAGRTVVTSHCSRALSYDPYGPYCHTVVIILS